ncbi:Hypothetical predicted protein [Octopus vulgaris]|uniref:Uncharacterized protein n=1 Tax=Octopus vulgaris TaxID=6645 RepID=A0AA36BFR3_OCTVU|nr:Hypothetical predicted protein [Octopus vulgaris]
MMKKSSTWRSWGGSYHGPRQVFEQKLSVMYDKHQQHMDVLRLAYENSLKVALMLMESEKTPEAVTEYHKRVADSLATYEASVERIWKKYDEVTADILADYTSKMKISGNKRNSNIEQDEKQ